ncbi:MAG: DNA repair protein RecN [Crocinitomicaceae bacterium]|nr:DNA repair protein RecN [Crocinitomicaceae bacterium]
MLKRLEISNYALIENVSLQLSGGFTAITGETGAGKSIILKALNLLLGDRADTSVLKQSDKKCFLEAEFDISGLDLELFFEEEELDFEPSCIIRREFTSSGKSRIFVNDTPVQLTQLKSLGERLVSIHSQHQTLEILANNFQMQVLDAFAGILKEVQQYQRSYRDYRNKVNEHIQLKLKDLENRKEKDYLSFLINELKMADLDHTNLEDLKIKSELVENAQYISDNIALAKSVFDNETFGPLNGIRTLLDTFEGLKKFDPKYADIHARLLSLKIEMDDLANEIDDQGGEFELSDAEAQQIKEKMDLLNSLCFKHNLSEVHELKALQEDLQSKLDDIDGNEDRMHELEAEIEQLKSFLTSSGQEIAKKRSSRTEQLKQEVEKILSGLGMPDAQLQIELSTTNELGSNGFNEVEFLFNTNKGGQFLPIRKVASGGELSRLMLAILSILSEHKKLPTLIFDEIDTGVSGEVASKIATEFVKMGKRIQLISITHLAQVAARGQMHLHVSKSTGADKTTTQVTELNADERVNELAKMISGEQVTEAAKENALHLLNIS